MKSLGFHIIITTYFFSCSMFSMAQPYKASNINDVKDQIKAANSFVQLSKYDTAIALCKQALALSEKLNYKSGQANIYDVLAEIMFKNGKLDIANQYNLQALPIATELRDTGLVINIRNRTGLFLLEKGQNKEAERNFTAALGLCGNKSQSLKRAEINSNLGSVKLALGEKEDALAYFIIALKIYERDSHAMGMGETYSNIASLYYLMGKIDDAIAYQKKSIAIRIAISDRSGLVITNNNIGQMYMLKGNNDVALQHIKQAIGYAEEIKNPKLLAASYSGMSVYNIRTKNFEQALIWQTRAIKLFEEIDDKPMLSRLYISAGNLANVGKDSTLATYYLHKGLQFSQILSNKENIANAYEKLSAFYLSHKNHENAYDNYKKFAGYKDSITEKSNFSKIEEIRTQFETEKKDNEILKLNTLQKLKQLQIEKQNAELNGNVIEAQKKQSEIELLSKETELQNFKIYQQTEELEKQTLISRNKEQELLINHAKQQTKDRQLKNETRIKNLLITGLIAGLILVILLTFLFLNRYTLKKKLEQQSALLKIRNTISQDLHDEIGSTLTSISILSRVSEQLLHEQPEKAGEMMNTISKQSKTIQQNMSDIVWSLRNENSMVESLVSRMREHAAQTLEPMNINVKVNVTPTLEGEFLPIEYRKEMLLIFKEATNNIARHANASNVKIQLQKTTNNIELIIADDGIWKGNSTGTGTKSMKERAGTLCGKLTITSEEKGTKVKLTVPIP